MLNLGIYKQSLIQNDSYRIVVNRPTLKTPQLDPIPLAVHRPFPVGRSASWLRVAPVISVHYAVWINLGGRSGPGRWRRHPRRHSVWLRSRRGTQHAIGGGATQFSYQRYGLSTYQVIRIHSFTKI